ncbi:MAG: TldD/PmbA family protein [Planctomycetota bacterium]
MDELVERAVGAGTGAGASHVEARIVTSTNESYEVRNGAPVAAIRSASEGLGVRAVVDGAWGFAAVQDLSPDGAERAAARAVEIGRASATARKAPVELADAPKVEGSYVTPHETDPVAVPVERKIDLLTRAERALQGQPDVAITQAFLSTLRKRTLFGNSAGSEYDQTILECGGGIAATAVRDGESQVRSYPNSFRGNFGTAGFEYVEALGLEQEAPRVAEEAQALLSAPPCPAGGRDVVIDGGQLALQVHESIGHPIELDRVFGTEAAYAGTSFLTPDKLGSFRYGSDRVNVVADATAPGGLGTFRWDDEGVPARRVPIIDHGTFVGYISDRESAAKLGTSSSGAARADGWGAIPLVRMTNINLLPGEWALDDLLADSDGGLFLATNRSWSIDDRRVNFQFGTEVAYEIEGGRLGRLYKNPSYTGITPEFWGSCDAVCGRAHWRLWGTPNCGKGEPGQSAHVGHGVAPARFRNVQVGVVR